MLWKFNVKHCRRYFPGYLFTRIELQWRGVRLSPGVIKLVMSGDEPSHVPDEVIAEIRKRGATAPSSSGAPARGSSSSMLINAPSLIQVRADHPLLR